MRKLKPLRERVINGHKIEEYSMGPLIFIDDVQYNGTYDHATEWVARWKPKEGSNEQATRNG